MSANQLADIADVLMGQSPPGDTCNKTGEGLPLLNGPTEFGSHHPNPVQFTTGARKQAQVGDLLFCVRGSTTGRMNWADQEYAIGRGIAAIRHRRDPRLQPFMRGLIENQLHKLLRAATGSTFPNVSAKQLAGISVPDLTDDEQLGIAQLLGALDDKIDLNRRMNETLEAMARAIFKDWFVDFGPTRAKAEGREPYLAPEIWELFPNAFDDEDKPVGWSKGELQGLIELNPREQLPKGTLAPYLEMAALPISGSMPEAPVERVFTSGTRFRNGDTLLARITPCLENGKTAFIQVLSSGVVGWGSTEFIVLRPIQPVPKPYAYILAREPSFRSHAIQSMTGTSGRQRARNEALAEYPVVIPDSAIWQAFGSIVEPLFERIRFNSEESRILTQTRDHLLPKLMSGQIRLREAEKAVEAVA